MNGSRWIPPWVAVLIFCAMVSVYLLPVPDLPKAVAVYGLWLLFALLSVLGAVLRGRREPWARTAWGLYGVSMALVALNAAMVVLRLLSHGTTAPPPSPGGFLVTCVSLVLTAAAIQAFSHAFEQEQRSWERLLDGAIFALAFYFLLWLLVLKPMQFVGVPPVLYWGWQCVFITLSASLGVAAHALTDRDVPLRSPAGILTLAFAFFAVVVPFWVRVQFRQGALLLHPVRMVLFLAYPLSLWATLAPWPERRANNVRLVFRLALPYLPALLAFGVGSAFYLARSSQRDGAGLGLLACLAWLLLLRQGLVIREIWDINRNLEGKVERRTRELQESQTLVARAQQMNVIATLGAGLAHDLNNLLAAAVGHLGLAKDRLPETARELDRVEAALAKAGGLTQRIMAIGREDAAPVGVVDLASHLRDMEPLLRALIPRSIELGLRTGPMPLPLTLDPATLDQVIVNLVSNARDATPAGGTIRIGAWAQAPWIHLEVEDTGSGIAPEVLGRIFEPFFTTKTSRMGTGLGLASVRTVVDGLGGEMEVKTEVGVGSRFIVRFQPADAS